MVTPIANVENNSTFSASFRPRDLIAMFFLNRLKVMGHPGVGYGKATLGAFLVPACAASILFTSQYFPVMSAIIGWLDRATTSALASNPIVTRTVPIHVYPTGTANTAVPQMLFAVFFIVITAALAYTALPHMNSEGATDATAQIALCSEFSIFVTC